MTDSDLERFWGFISINKKTQCWNFKSLKSNGYGQIRIGAKNVLAHRFSYEVNNGKIQEGLDLDHLCKNRKCVNPLHLQIVTRRENLLRGDTITKYNSEKQVCPKGHPYSGNNLLLIFRKKRRTFSRECKICHRENSLKRYHNLKENEKKIIINQSISWQKNNRKRHNNNCLNYYYRKQNAYLSKT
jgi:hypothetical protein